MSVLLYQLLPKLEQVQPWFRDVAPETPMQQLLPIRISLVATTSRKNLTAHQNPTKLVRSLRHPSLIFLSHKSQGATVRKQRSINRNPPRGPILCSNLAQSTRISGSPSPTELTALRLKAAFFSPR
ncbi:hypothetical protein MANI_024881 [Metarhizium anisopliae]|nr:hypothetical protein MANI_024881 [Metarhizium anisopliae]